MTQKQSRYPGALPFESHQQSIFFGRDKDVAGLCRLIRQEPITVLFGESGMGKSSLLNAGVIPYMEKSGEYLPLRIRFNAFDKDCHNDSQISPEVRCREVIKSHKDKVSTFLDKLIANEPTIWHDLKEKQIISTLEVENGNQVSSKVLLIFDQFEELFTYPPEAVLAFRKQLAEALFTPLPSRYWDILELYGQEESPLSESEQSLLQKPLELRVVMAIRHDKMHILNQLTDYLPNILKNLYNLMPLSLLQARLAIIAPAAFYGDFYSQPFRYDEKAISSIVDFLSERGTEPIECTQLQIICHSLERKVVQRCLKVINVEDIDDLNEVIHNYYLEKISLVIGETEQLAARKFVEEGLVYEDEQRRLSIYEGVIIKEYHITPATLQQLVDSHLLRAELSPRGGYTYELSHDTLVAPVLRAKTKRKADELLKAEQSAREIRERELSELKRKAEEERKRAENERELREHAELARTEAENQRSHAQKKEYQAKQRTTLAVVVSFVALALAFFAGWSYIQTRDAYKLAGYNAGLAEGEAIKAKTALANFLKEQAEKQGIVFSNREERANEILEVGGCPQELFQEMKEIIKYHPDSLLLKERLLKLHKKNPNCK